MNINMLYIVINNIALIIVNIIFKKQEKLIIVLYNVNKIMLGFNNKITKYVQKLVIFIIYQLLN